jgi:putative alpha-1,2-mannosidase
LSYAIGAPQLPEITLQLANGKRFRVVANDLSNKNRFIDSVTLNGKPLERSFITHNEIISGGELIFELSDKPNKNWARETDQRPPSMSRPP